VQKSLGWFNHFRKPRVCDEKTECSFPMLFDLAEIIIVFRKKPMKNNIVYA
jgi:hypothetical protein